MASRKVPFFNYPHVFTEDEEKLMEVIRDVGRRGAFILQKDLSEFEADLAEYMGVKYALGVSNGTDALLMGLRAAGIGAGDEVIFSSHTFVATAAAIHFVGATPVPVECGEDHQIDPKSIEPAITDRTKAIMPTQLNGRCCDMDALQAIADKHGLVIIEDAAQGLGAKYKGKMAGTFGLAAGMSFYPAKVLGSLGDSGAVFTNDQEIYENFRLQRDHGRDEKTGDVVAWGLNLRMDNLQAAILGYKLKTYPEVVKKRRHIAALYQENLGDLEELVLPPGPDEKSDHFDIYQNYELRAENRDALKAHLADHQVGTLVQWGGKAVHQFERLGMQAKLPFTEKLFEKALMLPCNPSLSDEDVHYVCETVKKFYKR